MQLLFAAGVIHDRNGQVTSSSCLILKRVRPLLRFAIEHIDVIVKLAVCVCSILLIGQSCFDCCIGHFHDAYVI